jgi:glutaredoxin 3
MAHKTQIYTMDHCPYCIRAKDLLRKRGIAYDEVHLAEDDDAAWEALQKKSKMMTAPQIFSGDRLIGGYTELAALDAQDQLASLKG